MLLTYRLQMKCGLICVVAHCVICSTAVLYTRERALGSSVLILLHLCKSVQMRALIADVRVHVRQHTHAHLCANVDVL